MVKETGDPLVEHGEPITVTSKPFKPWRKSGKVKVEFEIDTSGLVGKELVAFETASRLNGYKKGDDIEKTPKTVVAVHDKGQTVTIVSMPVHSPKTGDSSHIVWAIALLLLSAEAAYVVYRVRRSREDKDEPPAEE